MNEERKTPKNRKNLIKILKQTFEKLMIMLSFLIIETIIDASEFLFFFFFPFEILFCCICLKAELNSRFALTTLRNTIAIQCHTDTAAFCTATEDQRAVKKL